MVGKTALNKERYHLNGGPFQTLLKMWQEIVKNCTIKKLVADAREVLS